MATEAEKEAAKAAKEAEKQAAKQAKEAEKAEKAAKDAAEKAAKEAEKEAAKAAEGSTVPQGEGVPNPEASGATGQPPTPSAPKKGEPVVVRFRDHKGVPTERAFSLEDHGADYAKIADGFRTKFAHRLLK